MVIRIRDDSCAFLSPDTCRLNLYTLDSIVVFKIFLFFFMTKKKYINKIKIRRIVKSTCINADILGTNNCLQFSYFVQVIYLF